MPAVSNADSLQMRDDVCSLTESEVPWDTRAAPVVKASHSPARSYHIYGMANNHGFNATLTTTQGAHRLCPYLINTPTGGNALLTCRTITT